MSEQKSSAKKLIPGALFSPRAAHEQRLRASMRGEGEGPTDVRDHTKSWNRAAQGFRRADPNGEKLASLIHEVGQ